MEFKVPTRRRLNKAYVIQELKAQMVAEEQNFPVIQPHITQINEYPSSQYKFESSTPIERQNKYNNINNNNNNTNNNHKTLRSVERNNSQFNDEHRSRKRNFNASNCSDRRSKKDIHEEDPQYEVSNNFTVDEEGSDSGSEVNEFTTDNRQIKKPLSKREIRRKK